ncbi:hypothetical protein [Ornithinimicrobium sp. LYQ103]|uniref:hypothetical protein n=1 Tax=Ornithinimicrobium sp. LYQ103 TaxID=3378796 RepID=UPI0038535EEF
MQHVILGLLLSGPLSAYDLHRRFTAGISLFYSASLGGIQRALAQLLADGSVTASKADDTRRGRTAYAATARGREAWRAWMLEEQVTGVDPETTMLAKVYLLGLADAQDRPEVLQSVRRRAARDLEALLSRELELDALDDVPAGSQDVFGHQRATLDYGIRSHRLALTWLDDMG